MITRYRLMPQIFNPVRSFMAVACGDEKITIKEEYMASFDLQLAIDKTAKLHDTLVMAKGAIVGGSDPAPILADAVARLPEVANAMGHFVDPINDDAARAAVEGVDGHEMREAAE